MIDNRKIAEITGVWGYYCDRCHVEVTDMWKGQIGLSFCCESSCMKPWPPDFLHDAEAFVKVLDWLIANGYFFRMDETGAIIGKHGVKGAYRLTTHKDHRTALLLAVQQIGDKP